MGIVTWPTVLAVGIAGSLLGVYLWRTARRVHVPALITLWIAGTAFTGMMASARLVDGSTHWEAWIGAGLLWSEYVLAALIVVLAWRRWVMRQER